ncbi:MAG: family 20 glycosylhydrolase [Ancrocorticia sp.]
MNSDIFGLVPRPFNVRITSEEEYPLMVDDDVRLTTDTVHLRLPVGAMGWQKREAYRLEVRQGRPTIWAFGPDGVRHARRILAQLRRVGPVPDMTIIDRPEFPWRGLSVDIVRHFFGPDDLVRVLDLMADLGFNRLHLHLSDDQGWRIEVPAFPELVEKSSGSCVGGGEGGYLTLEDMAYVSKEAAARGIVVVPEVDVPGHTTAALHALPDLNPDGVTPDLHEGIEVGISTLSRKAPLTAPFLDAVVDTLYPFSSEGIHVGGDECLLTPPEEFGMLVKMAVDRVHGRGRCAIAWQEAASQLAEGDLLQIWDERQDMSEVIHASRRGVGVIASPASKVYLDMKYDESERLGLVWAGTTTLRQSYEWDARTFIDDMLPESVVGVEACIFTETIETIDELIYMLMPRLAAVAEVAWVGSGLGGWDSFARRVTTRARSWDFPWYRSPEVAELVTPSSGWDARRANA